MQSYNFNIKNQNILAENGTQMVHKTYTAVHSSTHRIIEYQQLMHLYKAVVCIVVIPAGSRTVHFRLMV